MHFQSISKQTCLFSPQMNRLQAHRFSGSDRNALSSCILSPYNTIHLISDMKQPVMQEPDQTNNGIINVGKNTRSFRCSYFWWLTRAHLGRRTFSHAHSKRERSFSLFQKHTHCQYRFAFCFFSTHSQKLTNTDKQYTNRLTYLHTDIT